MAASAHSWDFLLLRLRELRLPLLRGPASRMSGPMLARRRTDSVLLSRRSVGRSKIDADILPPRGWQPLNFLQRTASYL